jgi:Protein of unknown function (DUF1566)
MKKFVVLAVAFACFVGLAACSDTRVRNAAVIKATACQRPGQTKKVSGVNYACARTAQGSVWLATSSGAPSPGTCRTRGATRTTATGDLVCALRQGKTRWLNLVRPLSGSAAGATTAPSGSQGASNAGAATPSTSPEENPAAGNIAENPVALAEIPAQQLAEPVVPVAELVSWSGPVTAWSVDGSVTLSAASVPSSRDISYVVSNAGETGCTLDAETLVLSYTNVGRCIVTASVAETPNYFASQADVPVDVDVACRFGFKCRVGDPGPGGGTVVYVAPSPQKWGTYIEVAPAGWSGAENGQDPKLAVCNEAIANWYVASAVGIGTGAGNTAALASSGCSGATLVDRLSLNGQDNWHIPSREELEAMCEFLKNGAVRNECTMPGESNAFGLNGTHYWSSSASVRTGDNNWMRRFQSSVMGFSEWPRSAQIWVRPVRYFGLLDQQTISVYPRTVDFGRPAQLYVWGGSGDGAVSYSVVDAGSAGCAVTGEQLTAADIGTCTVQARKAASGTYVASASAPTTITVVRSQPWISVTGYFGYAGASQAPIELGLMGSPGITTVTYEVVSRVDADCQLEGNRLRSTRPGDCTVRASFAGDSRYLPAKSMDRVFKFLVSCESGGPCFTGDIGPSGGRIFFMTGPTSFFTDFLTGEPRRYMEAAPANWADSIPSRKSADAWGCESIQLPDADSKFPGGGSKNTAEFRKVCESQQNIFAQVDAYRGGGFDDWYVPSQVELNELCKFARQQLMFSRGLSTSCDDKGTLREDFAEGLYWSSTQYGSKLAMAQLFGPDANVPDVTIGKQTPLVKSVKAQVRPIRNFCRGWCPVIP